MKSAYIKLLAILASSFVLFAACTTETEETISLGTITYPTAPTSPATDPDIPDGSYFYSNNTIVTIKKNSEGKTDGFIELKEYVNYATYKSGTAIEGEDIYVKTWHLAYTVEWLGSKCARKVVGDDGHIYYFYLYGSLIQVRRSEELGYSETNLEKLDNVKGKWALPDAGATYVSKKKYDSTSQSEGTYYLYVVVSSDLKTVTFYRDETNTASPSGDTNKLGEIQDINWVFTKSMVRASNSDWRIVVMKKDSEATLEVVNSTSDSSLSATCVKKP